MKFTVLALAAALNAAAFSAPACAQAVPAVTQAAYDLEADVTRVLKTFDVPGIAIAVVKDGKVAVARGFGVKKLGEDTAVDENTLFEIASNSKGFTAALLAMLVDEGKLAWDDPVLKHLPDFQMYDAYVTREMTVRDLLVHRSGLGLGAGDLMWWPTSTLTADEIIHRLRYIRPATSFRSAYAYDNLLYIVATRIIERKTGKQWGQVVRERILAPLGMRSTTTSLVEHAGNPNVAAAHSKFNDKTAVVRALPVQNAAGAVGINSSAADISRWMNVLLNGGQIEGGARLWSQDQARELWTAQTPMTIREPHALLADTRPNFLAYALGFQVRDYKGMKLVQHGGALRGFYSRVLMVPQARLGIAIFTNAENDWAIAALQYRLLDQYLGAASASAPVDWIDRVHQAGKEAHAKSTAAVRQAAQARNTASRPSLALSAYEGQYSDPWYGTATIGRQGSRQVLAMNNNPDLVGHLEHFQYDTFIVRWHERSFNADAYVTFSLNPDGSIERMRMAPVSSETDFSYDFQDLMFTPVKGKKP